jgi:hypothetical protein
VTTYRTDTSVPVEKKVIAAAVGAGAAAVLSEYVVRGVDRTYWTGAGARPGPAPWMLAVLVTAGLTYAAAYRAEHTNRPDLHEHV